MKAWHQCGTGCRGVRDSIGTQTGRGWAASQESHSLIMLTFVFKLYYWSFAIYASDKSAFCKRQLSIYDTPSTQKEKLCDPPSYKGKPQHM